MTTSKFLSITFGVMILLSVVAAFWNTSGENGGRIPLVWVSDDSPTRNIQIDAFNAENPDLDLRLDFGNRGLEKVILQCGSGVGPDIFDYSDEDIGTYVESGIPWDVTEAASRMQFSAWTNGWPASINTVTYNGRQYGFPCNTGAVVLVYNKNVFDYFGVPYPEGPMTWEEFVVMARKVNSLTSPQSGEKRRIYAVNGATWRIFFDTLRGEFFTADGQLDIVDSEALRKAFETHRQFVLTDRLMPSTVEARSLSGRGGWGGGDLNQFTANRYAMIVTGYWSLIAFSRAYHEQVKNLEAEGVSIEEIKNPLERPLRLGVILVPNFAGHPPAYRVESRVASINARSPHREEALRFLQFLAGPTYSRIINEGIDWLPGNPKYAQLGVEPGPPDLNRIDLQKATEDAMNYGYSPRRSPFLLSSDVARTLANQISRLESNPAISTDSVLRSADAELRTLMRRNLERSPALKALYIERFGEESYKRLSVARPTGSTSQPTRARRLATSASSASPLMTDAEFSTRRSGSVRVKQAENTAAAR